MRTFFALTEEGALDSYISFLNMQIFLVKYGNFSFIDFNIMSVTDFLYFYRELERVKKDEDRDIDKISNHSKRK